jgi:sulfur-carrier protein adenylyltransferase/sulfurtransferase
MASLSDEQRRRYSRHILLPEVGEEGQEKLLSSSVVVLGAGGLGSPAALYLAAAGVGKLGIVDFDEVDLSNLQRQILHHGHDVGRPKVDSAREIIHDVNSDVEVITYRDSLSPDNILGIIGGYDVVLDCSDNFPTRYLINDACVLAGKPEVYGAIFRFDGQVTVFKQGSGCYRCLYPEAPPPDVIPPARDVGVLGVLPGLVGVIQATEALKLLLGVGDPLTGRLILIDSLAMDFREINLRRDPECPICGDHPTITTLTMAPQ